MKHFKGLTMKKVKISKRKRAYRLLKGLQAQWTVVDPLREVEEGEAPSTKFTHKSPVTNMEINQNIALYIEPIRDWPHRWEVLIEAEFKDFEGKPYFRHTDINEATTFTNLHDTIADAVEAVFNSANMKHYVTTHMTATIK